MERFYIEHLPAQAESWIVVDTDLQIVVADCDTEEEAKSYVVVREGRDSINRV